MDYNSLMQQISQKRQDVGQRTADLPNIEANIRSSLFGNDPYLKNMQGQERDKVSELFSHDQAVADRYKANPLVSPDGLPLDPYIREVDLSNRYKGTVDQLTGIRQNAQTRRDVLGDALEKAVKMLQYGLDAQKWEAEFMMEQAKEARSKEESDRAFASKGAGGGTDKRSQDATDQFLADMIADVNEQMAKDPNADKKSLVWRWINANEPYFKSAGVNANSLWDVYNKTPGRQASAGGPGPLVSEALTPKPSRNQNPLAGILGGVK